ncbi:pyocin knob domain-containing protein [Atlantibacter hermannii]|uniref:pyocin knob domain-containing protein n=1 Tax=Atlantibacter hermannii TaxID=565 RepID=UPI0028A80FA6|nr:pyocin knob domain-containing protein [Atlantibacter hermannii]
MSAGTLKLTSNSTAVVGTSTLFTTDLKPGDFITATIGGVLYTLPVDTVTSNTAATLVSPFTGPTTTGAAWAAVPRKVLSQVTADLVAQTTAAMRGMNNDKANWQSFYSAAGDINITLPDGTKVPGPSWAKMAGMVSSSQQWRGNLPAAANLNAYGPTPDVTGTWNRSSNTNTTAAYGFPEDNGQGILEVFAGGRYGGLQRYTVSTSGNVYIRSLTGAWNGTDGPWSDWLPAGIQTRMSFFTGDLNTLKAPGEWSVTTPFTGGPTDIPGICEVIPRLNGTGLIQRYTAISTGAASINRTWQRTLSGTTWSGWESVGIKPLNDLGIGLTNLTALSAFDWQQVDFATGAVYLTNTSAWVNTPTGVSYPANTQVYVQIDGITSSGTVIELTLIANQANDATWRVYKVRIANAKGSRTFSVRQIFTSTDVVPVANGGTGAATPAGARTALELGNAATRNVGSVPGTVAAGDDPRLNTVDGKSGGTLTSALGRTNATPGSFDSLYTGNKNFGLYFEQMNVPGAGYLYPHISFKMYWAGNYGGAFTWSAWANTKNPEYVLSWTYEVGTTPSQWRFNASTGNATATGNWINGGSSIEIKEKVEDIQNPRETMRKIRACTWRLKTKNADGRFGIGVLAEGLYEDYPEAQVTSGDIELRDGTVVKDALSVQAGDSGVLAAVHHAAIISLMDENEAQQNKIESQQVEIETLKSNLEELKKIVEGLIAN